MSRVAVILGAGFSAVAGVPLASELFDRRPEVDRVVREQLVERVTYEWDIWHARTSGAPEEYLAELAGGGGRRWRDAVWYVSLAIASAMGELRWIGGQLRLAGHHIEKRSAAAGREPEFALGFLPQFAPMGRGPAGAAPVGGAAVGGGAPMAMRSAPWPAPAARACPVWAAWRAGRGRLADICHGRRGGAGWLQADGRRARGRPVRLDGGAGDLFSNSEIELNRESPGGILSVWSRRSRSLLQRPGRRVVAKRGRADDNDRGGLFARRADRGPVTGADARPGRLPGHKRRADEYVDDRVLPVGGLPGHQPGLGVEGIGYGTGALRLTPDGRLGAGDRRVDGDISSRGAGRGDRLVGHRRFALAFKADALWVGAGSEPRNGAASRLNASEAGVTRVRRALEGWRGLHARRAAVADTERWRWGCAATAATPRRAREWTWAAGSPSAIGSLGCRSTCGRGRWWCTKPKASPSGGCRCRSGGIRRRRGGGADCEGGLVMGRAGAGRGQGAVGQPEGLRDGLAPDVRVR